MAPYCIKKAKIILALFFLFPAGYLTASGPWEEIDSRSGITIYERWVTINNDMKVRERRGEMTITSEMSSVINILCDPSKTNLWMENVSDAYLVNKASDNEWSSYTYFSMPWPFASRDMVSVSRLDYSDPSSVTIEMISMEKALPKKENVIRLENYKATWKIKDLGNGQIFVSLSAISFTSPEFPRLLMDPVVRGVFMRNMLRLKVLFCL
jgi:hypothetical protein